MKQKYNVMLIDDEEKGIALLEDVLQPFAAEFQIVAKCNSASEAKKEIVCGHPDLIFLDIQMPEINGFDLIKELKSMHIHIPFIFVTAYKKYMYESFKYQPFNYLLKPIDRNELAEDLLRFKSIYPLSNKIAPLTSTIGILTEKGIEVVRLDELVYIHTEHRKSCMHLKDGSKTLTHKTLKDFIKTLPNDRFIQIHKSVIINFHYIAQLAFPYLYLKIDKKTIKLTIGRAFFSNLKNRLPIY